MIITDQAKAFIENMMKENDISTLRFTFEGAGCCGPNYGLTLAPAETTDIVQNVNGISVAIDPQVKDLVEQMTLDYVEDEQGAGLTISGGASCC